MQFWFLPDLLTTTGRCHAGERWGFAGFHIFYKIIFFDSAALNHPNFWKNYLEAADAIRLIVELGWPIPPSFEDTLIHVFSHFTSTTPSIVEHTRCAILRALGGHMSTTSYMECCVQLCLKHAGALLTIAERHTSESKKVDSSISLAVPNFVSNLLACCPLLVEVTWWTVRVRFFFLDAQISFT